MDYMHPLSPGSYDQVWIDQYQDTFFVRNGCIKTLKNLILIATENGGEVLSRLWSGNDTKVTLSCSRGHIWQATARPVLYQDSWCPTCAFDGQWKGHTPERPRRSFKDALALASETGIEHLGDVTNIRQSTIWRCKEGHTWEEPARAILIRGFFCQKCEGRPAKMLQRAHEIAASRGGLCLSTEYINNRQPMDWECAAGHVWSAPYKNVGTNGSWCLQCANAARRRE